jgi:hypothetical protein
MTKIPAEVEAEMAVLGVLEATVGKLSVIPAAAVDSDLLQQDLILFIIVQAA